MDSPVRKAQKRNDYQRHKLFRKMKRQREARRKQEAQVAEKELKRRLQRPRFDEGSDDKVYKNVAPQYRSNNTVKNKPGEIIYADPNTNTAVWRDQETGKERTIELPNDYWIYSNVPEMMFQNVDNTGEINQEILSNAGIKRLHRKLYPVSNKYYRDPLLGSYARFIDSWNNNTNPIKAIWDQPATQVAASDLLFTKGLGLLKNSPNVNYSKLGKMTLKDLDEFFNQHPNLVKKLGDDVVSNYKQYFKNIVEPKFKQILKQQNIPYSKKTQDAFRSIPNVYGADFGKYSKWGGYTTSSGKVMMNTNKRFTDNDIFQRFVHEMAHHQRNELGKVTRFYPTTKIQTNPYKSSTNSLISISRSGYTPKEIEAAENAFQFPQWKFDNLPDIDPLKEKMASISQWKQLVSSENANASGKVLDDIFMTMPEERIISDLNRINGYTKSFIKYPGNKKWLDAVRNAPTQVASVSPFGVPIVLGMKESDGTSYMRGKNLKMPKFKPGSDDTTSKTTYTLTERTMPNGSKIYFDEEGNELTPTTLGLVNKSGTVQYNMPDLTPFEDWKWNGDEQQELNAQQRLGRYMQNAPARDIDKVMLGTLALGAAPVSLNATPALTAGFVGDMAGGIAGDVGINALTKATYGRSFSDMLWDKMSIPQSVGSWLNPGIIGGATLGRKSVKKLADEFLNVESILKNPDNFRFDIGPVDMVQSYANLLNVYNNISKKPTLLLPKKDSSINVVNEILDLYGYEPIKTNLPESQIEKQFVDRMKQHRRVLRGVYIEDPRHSTIGFDRAIRNLQNVKKQAKILFGDTSDESILKTMATTTSIENTGHGKMGFDSYLDYMKRRMWHTGQQIKKDYRPLYTSNIADVAKGYSTSTASKSQPGGSYLIQIPINDNPGSSYIDRWIANEFPIASEVGGITPWRSHILPYVERFKKLPEDPATKNMLAFRDITENNAVGSIPLSPQEINIRALHNLHGNIYIDQNSVTDANNILNKYGLSGVQIKWNPYYDAVNNALSITRIVKNVRDADYILQQYLDPSLRNGDVSGIISAFEQLKQTGLITDKQYRFYIGRVASDPPSQTKEVEKIVSRIISRAKEFDRSILFKHIIKKNNALQKAKENEYRRRMYSGNNKYTPGQDFTQSKRLDRMENFVYEYNSQHPQDRVFSVDDTSKDGLRVFTTEGIRYPDPHDLSGTHYIFVDKPNKKLGEVVEKLNIDSDRTHHGHFGRYYPGTSRNLGATIPFAFALGYNMIDTKHNSGKDIHIKPSRRGTFIAAAKKHGMGVQQYARKVLKAPKGKYSAAMRRKANFARNASKWAH